MLPTALLSSRWRAYAVAALILVGVPSGWSGLTLGTAGAAATDPHEIFLFLPGVSTQSVVGAEKLTSFTLSTVATGQTSIGTGLGASKAISSKSTATATMPIDQATVGLLSDLAKSTKLAKLTVDFRQAGVASPYTYLTYKFTNAYVTSFLLRDDASGVSIQVTFDFEQIAATYYTQKADGSTSAGAVATWNTGLTKSG